MRDLMDRLVRYLVCAARAFEPDAEAALDPNSGRGIYDHDSYANASYVFLALYLNDHPANPYFGKSGALDMYVRLVDGWLRKWEASVEAGEPYRFPEWCNYIMCRGHELAGDRLGPELRGRIEKLIAHFVERDLPRPFFFTAPNHEIWKLNVAWLAGHLLARPEWREQAEFEAKQMIAWQTPEGFWEEGRHHGPSMRYNFVTLSGMARMAQRTGDPCLRDAAARLAGFIGRWVFPDGVSIGALDGRRPTAPGQLSPGLELAPEGLTYLDRTMEFWDRHGWLDPDRSDGPLFRRAMKGDWIAADSLFYYADLFATGAAAPAPNPLDADGATLENHSAYFDATVVRRGPWAIALSGQLSDVPKDTQFIYRLERQSRIEVWHERACVVIGGGHSLVTAKHPTYNVWVEPGYHADPDGFSAPGNADAGSPAMARRRSKYYPRAASSGVSGDAAWLELVFAHATVRFEFEPLGAELAIRYTYRAVGVEELRIALPVLLWEGAKGFADGRLLPPGGEAGTFGVEQAVVVECPLFGTEVTLSIPGAGNSRVLYPLAPMQSYIEAGGKKLPAEHFSLAFVETVLSEPGRSGSGEWRLKVG